MPTVEANSPHPKLRINVTKVFFRLALVLGAVALLQIILSLTAKPNARNIARDRLNQVASEVIAASSLSPSEKEDAVSTCRAFLAKAVADQVPKDKLDPVLGEFLGGPYGRLLKLTAIQHAIEKSRLGKDTQTEALDKLRILSSTYSQGQLSGAELAPVIEAIPMNATGQPAALPWIDADLDRVLSRIDPIGGTCGKRIQLAAVGRAIAKSSLVKKEKSKASQEVQSLSSGYAQKVVSDTELATVLDAIPKDQQGQFAKPPWESADLQQVLARVRAVLGTGKQIKPDNPQPDFPDDLRRTVGRMKEALR